MPLQYAIANIARAANTRSNYATATQRARSAFAVTFTINGTDRTRFVSRYESEINDQQNETPNTATLMVRGFIPTVGQTVTITRNLDNSILFSGVVTDFEQVQRRTGTRFRYRLACTDWTFLLDRRLVTYIYGSQSASTTAADILARFTSGFTPGNLQPALASVDFTLKMESVSQAFTRLANLVGAFWYIDYEKDLHFRTSENLPNPTSLTTSATFKRLKYTKTIGQIRTRVKVEGQGTTTAGAVAVGATIVPVLELAIFPGTGTVIAGGQEITYTGRQFTATVVARPAPLTGPTVVINTLGAHDELGLWSVKSTFVYSDGVESTASPASNDVNLVGANDSLLVSNLLLGDANVTKRWIYENKPSVGAWRGNTGQPDLRFSTADNTRTSVALGAATAGSALVPPAAASNFAAGSTFLYVSDISVFSPSGGTATSPNSGQTFTYTGRTAATGVGALTGIPASGTGALTGTLIIGDTVYPGSGGPGTLTGCTGIVFALNQGDDVNLLVTRNDVTAQTTLAALEGGDGIHEHYIQDRRLSLAGAQARGDAELTLGKDPDELATFTTEDANAFSGRSITITISSISTTLKIQQVRIYWTVGRWSPQRDVTATNRFKDFYQFVRDLQEKATRPL